MRILRRLAIVAALCMLVSGCVGMVVGAAVDTAIEVAKVPFKVAGAVVDVATGDGESKRKKKRKISDDDGDE